jgi:SAM-dependent methyltransferase
MNTMTKPSEINAVSQAAAVAAADLPDYDAIKTRQQATWGSGDYGRIGVTLQITGEQLCEAMDLRSGQSVLDVAGGNGNATLAAARRFCNVVSSDYVASLLAQSRVRAEAEGLDIDYREADAENLPFADARFDNVISTFGVMFTPNQPRAASELLRVCRPGGRIGMANWTPEGFIGRLFKTIGHYLPRLSDRPGLEQHGVDDAEDGDVQTDAEPEHRGGERHESGVLGESPYCLPHVLPHAGLLLHAVTRCSIA